MGAGVSRNQRFGMPTKPTAMMTIDGNASKPAETVCMMCARTLEELDTACERAECPLRPRQDQRLMCDP
jgi:hypothetical protein